FTLRPQAVRAGQAYPSSGPEECPEYAEHPSSVALRRVRSATLEDRKSTRLNSSHGSISYAVFCLKKKKKKTKPIQNKHNNKKKQKHNNHNIKTYTNYHQTITRKKETVSNSNTLPLLDIHIHTEDR